MGVGQGKPQALVWFVLVVVWMALIFWFSAHNAPNSAEQSGVVLRSLQEVGLRELTMHTVRKMAHGLLYCVLGALLLNYLRSYTISVRRQVGLAVFCAALYALSDEIHQAFSPGRSAQLGDVLLDTCAALSGVAALHYSLQAWHKRFRKTRHTEVA